MTLARRYLRALETEAPPDALSTFLSEDVVQREYPNRLVPEGATRDLAALLAGNQRGRSVLSGQRYEVRSALVDGDAVALEVRHFPQRAGSGSQRNYDCFAPF